MVWLVTRNNGTPSPAAEPNSPGPTVTSTSTTPGVSTNAKELLDRLDNASKATFHVRYTTGASSGDSAVLEIWHTPNKVRRDVIAVSATEGTAHTIEILANNKYVRCVKLKANPWQCAGAPTDQAGTLKDPLQGAGHDVAGKTVTLSHTTIAGHPASCYTIPASGGGQPSQFCLSADNVPLRIDGGDGKPVDATNYDTNVPDSVFTPPAAVTGG